MAMNISEKAKQHIDACRFCWMCRHICPIGNATGQERNTARARALGLSLVVRGAEKTEDVAGNIYECALCGACVKECVTGWDPVMFVQEAKTDAVLSGCIPGYIEKMLENDEKTGNIYGKALPDNYPCAENSSDTLLFAGVDARYNDVASVMGANELLLKAGVKADILKDEPDSGYDMWFLTGNTAEAQQKAEECARVLNKYKTVVVYDPADLSFIKRNYKEWAIDVSARVISFAGYLLQLIESKKLEVVPSGREYTAQDSFHTARELENSAEIRKLVSLCGENKEMLLNGKDTFFAGSLIMNEYMPQVMKETALRRIASAESIGATTVVAESPAEYLIMRAAGTGMRIINVQEMITENLKR